jgi:dTDP-4-amino-4,6-dideoxygalactose transaminase
MQVPFIDLKAQYESIKDEIDDAVRQVIDSCAFAGGRFVEKFEHEFAQFCGSEYAIGVGSGTEALWLSLMVLGIGDGDEVITVPNTFIATVEAIHFCGAKPVLVDIEEKTYNMDPRLFEKAITKKTKAVIPVHIFGQPADMDPILKIAEAHNLYVIEDACQAHGAEYKGRRVGAIGDIGCFSFYPGKNLGAYGDAGALVCSNRDWAVKLAMMRDHGQNKKYCHKMIGWNARMDGLQGAVLSAKIRYLPRWNELRRKWAGLYDELLKEVHGIIPPLEADYAKHVYHVYALRIKGRNLFLDSLARHGIQASIHYPLPIHLQQPYSSFYKGNGTYPVAEKCAEQFLSLPMFPELSEIQVRTVVKGIKDIMQHWG